MKRVGILLIVLVVLALIGAKLNGTEQPKNTTVAQLPTAEATPLSPEEEKARQEKWFGAETIVAAKRAVRQSLKDPESAEFKDVFANYTEEFGVVACGYVNAKNALGGYTGYKAFVSAGKSVIMEGRDDIVRAWGGACK